MPWAVGCGSFVGLWAKAAFCVSRGDPRGIRGGSVGDPWLKLGIRAFGGRQKRGRWGGSANTTIRLYNIK